MKILILKKIREIFGRRQITAEEEAKYSKINKIEEIKKIYAEYNITKEELENNVLEKEQDSQDRDIDIEREQEEFEIE